MRQLINTTYMMLQVTIHKIFWHTRTHLDLGQAFLETIVAIIDDAVSFMLLNIYVAFQQCFPSVGSNFVRVGIILLKSRVAIHH